MRKENINNFEGVERWFVIALTVWATCGFIAARSGLISGMPRLVLGPLILIETAVPILVYYRSERFHAYISSIDLKHLTIFHLWRLLAGFTFLAYGSRHLLPSAFISNAGYGDILVGLLVPVVLVLPRGTGKYLAFHTIGMLDFILAVGTGITLTLQQAPVMWNITAYPVVLIPLLGVPISGAMHVMALDIAWKRYRTEGRKEDKMRNVQMIVIIIGLLFALTVSAEKTHEAMKQIEPLPRDLEIQLALSALPPHLRDNATVYVLNPGKGFEVARKGTNGFHAFVARTGDDTFRGDWPFTEYRDDILYPISFDAAGAKEQMRVFFDAAEMQANGTPPGELKKIIKDRYKKGYYKAPERAGVSYMVSPILRTYVNPEGSDKVATSNNPHVMYYAPNVSNEDIGGKPPSISFAGYGMEVGGFYPFVIMPGPHGYMIHLLDLTERAAINKEYEEMLARLCKIKEVWCLPKEKGQH